MAGSGKPTQVVKKVVKFEMTLPEALELRVLEWRRRQPDLPSRNEALRRLVLKGLASDPEDGR
jgi:hypothetical protein